MLEPQPDPIIEVLEWLLALIAGHHDACQPLSYTALAILFGGGLLIALVLIGIAVLGTQVLLFLSLTFPSLRDRHNVLFFFFV